MKAAVFYGKDGFSIEEFPVPQPRDGQMLVKVLSCGICGGEYNVWKEREEAGHIQPGVILGHEFMGDVVIAAAPFKVGDRVVVAPDDGCDACDFCRRDMPFECREKTVRTGVTGGGYAEYALVKPSQCYRLPKDVSPIVFANTEPLACCIHSLERMQVHIGDTAAVIGAGAGAQMMIQLLKINGCRECVVFDTRPERLSLAREHGATECLSLDASDPIPQQYQEHFDHVFVTRSSAPYEEMGMRLAGFMGTVLIYGVAAASQRWAVQSREIWRRQISIVGSRSFRRENFSTAVRLLSSGLVRVDKIVNRVIPLEQIPEALMHPEGFLKTVIAYK